MLKHVCAAILFAFALAAPSEAQQTIQPQTPEAWSAAAVSDLDAARELIRAQTPIPYDIENPQYAAWLEEGYALARPLAEQAHDFHSYYFALARFANGFRDPHLGVNPAQAFPTADWPGFVAGSRNGGAVVTWREESDPDAPPIGAQITSCDGKPLAELADERLFPYMMNPRIALDRRRALSRLFMRRVIPSAPAPSRCTIVVDGAEREIALRWRPIPDQAAFSAAYQDASVGPAAQWGVTQPTPGVFWIGVPTFNSSEATSPRLQALIDEVNAHPEMRNARAIVIDVRGNGGGNSVWADQLALGVFGEEVIEAIDNGGRTSAVDWRASPENLAYWQRWIDETATRDFGANSPQVRFGRSIVSGLRGAQRRNPPIWRQGDSRVSPSGGLTQSRPRGPSPISARVYMLSNGTCGSSCLNFADTVLQVPGVQLIGSDTSGDGPYMEVRNETLPSGLATLTFPQKVWRGMGRGALEAYVADVAYDGSWDDASVRAWTLALIEQQSASR